MSLNKSSTLAPKTPETRDPAPKATPQTVSQILDMGALDIRAALATGEIMHTCERLDHSGSRMSVIASFIVCPQELGEELEKQLIAVVDEFFERCGISGAIDEPPIIH